MDIIIRTEHRKNGVRTIVKAENGNMYAVDTAYTYDAGPETMVFNYNKNTDSITNWADLYVRHYDTMGEAYVGHEEISRSVSRFIATA